MERKLPISFKWFVMACGVQFFFSDSLLPNQQRELMWTRFHWFRTNPNNVDIGLKFFGQFAHGNNNILKQVLQSMLTQLTVTVSIFVNKADAPQTDDTEALGPMINAEKNALCYVAGWALSKLKKKFVNCDSDKSKTISVTLKNLEESGDSKNFLAHTKNWTAMQNRGGLTTCFSEVGSVVLTHSPVRNISTQ